MDLIDSLVEYVKDIKPYHTKIYGVDVEYRASEDVNVSITEDLKMQIFLGVPFRGDLDEYRWGVDGYPYIDDPAFDELGQAVFDQYFQISRGWDSVTYDSATWDEDLIMGVPNFKNSGLMYDNIYVQMTETLSFELNDVTVDVEDCVPIVHTPWDADIDGISIISNTNTSIILHGDLRQIFEVVTTFAIIESEFNDGIQGVIDAIFDPVTYTTTVLVTMAMVPATNDGKVQISMWDAYGTGWDGDVEYFTPHPDADIYARTQFTESLRMVDGYTWDDNVAGGWDNLFWDDALLIFNHTSDSFTYDTESPCANLPAEESGITTVNNPVGIVVFSAENMHAPVPLVDYPIVNPNIYFEQTVIDIGWTAHTITNVIWSAVAYSPTVQRFVAVALHYSGTVRIAYSSDAVTWTPIVFGNSFSDVIWIPELNMFYAVGSNANNPTLTYYASSPDGITWTHRFGIPFVIGSGLSQTNFAHRIVWSPELNLLVVVSSMWGPTTPYYIVTSPDGITWTHRPVVGNVWINSPNIIWCNTLGLFVILGNGDTILKSSDGINWTLGFLPTLSPVISGTSKPTWSETRGVITVITWDGRVLTSIDAITWNVVASGQYNTNNMATLTLDEYGGVSVRGDTTGHAYFSRDDVTWIDSSTVPDDQGVNCFCWAPDQNMIVGVKSSGSFKVTIGIPQLGYV